jgi:DNA-binding XRE family transcriptional regulator
MKITPNLSDTDVLLELGRRLAERRIRGGYSQLELALAAGVAKRSVERCEAGRPIEDLTLVRMLRVFDGGASVDLLLPEVEDRSPTVRRRVGRRRVCATARG